MTPPAFIPRLEGFHWDQPLGKVVCVGRNYAEHAAELNNPVPTEPLLFIKPATAAVPLEQPLSLPTGKGQVHYETELALLIGTRVNQADPARALQAVYGVGLALDLTLRDLQQQLKEKGHPWEKAKAWDASCPLSTFVPAAAVKDWNQLEISLKINGQERQRGRSSQLLTPLAELLGYISHHFTLLPGDVVLTGTPAGVGALQTGDRLELELAEHLRVEHLRVEHLKLQTRVE